MSGAFALGGLLMALWLRSSSRFKGTRCAEGVFFFFLMEVRESAGLFAACCLMRALSVAGRLLEFFQFASCTLISALARLVSALPRCLHSPQALQFVQYSFIAENLLDKKCEEMINKVLTVLGFLHICLQPYYTHVLNASMTHDPDNKHAAEMIRAEAKPRGTQTEAAAVDAYIGTLRLKHAKFSVIQKLCLVGGMLLFSRMALAYAPGWSTLDFAGDAKASAVKPMVGNALASTEWLRGEKLCTWKGNYHLAWSVPMADPTYNVMGAGIHSFLMFGMIRGALALFSPCALSLSLSLALAPALHIYTHISFLPSLFPLALSQRRLLLSQIA